MMNAPTLVNRPAGSILLLMLVFAAPAGSAAEVERIALQQRPDIEVQHQRLVGNQRAQARREGVVVSVPQLYVYLSDRSPAFHLDGFRPGFERELALIVDRSRTARTMVRLDRLLERVMTPGGAAFRVHDLPPADVYLLIYQRADCADCRRVAETIESWLAARDEPLRVVWLDVKLGAG